MPPAAKNPFEKGFLDLPKLFIKVFLRPVFFASLRVSSRFKKISKWGQTKKLKKNGEKS
jgi:hypothetical protein